MCFSASASFAASAVLGAVGVATLRKVEKPQELVFGSFPMLFAIQQFSEGMIWVYIGDEFIKSTFSYIYFSFLHVLWPVFCPLSVYLIEPNKSKKKVMLSLVFSGLLFAIYDMFFIYQSPVGTCIVENHIEYHPGVPNGVVMSIIYLFITVTGFLISSSKIIRIYGWLLLLSIMVTGIFYFEYFLSVWCFFGALLSLISYFYFNRTKEKLTPSPDHISSAKN